MTTMCAHHIALTAHLICGKWNSKLHDYVYHSKTKVWSVYCRHVNAYCMWILHSKSKEKHETKVASITQNMNHTATMNEKIHSYLRRQPDTQFTDLQPVQFVTEKLRLRQRVMTFSKKAVQVKLCSFSMTRAKRLTFWPKTSDRNVRTEK